MRSSSSLVSGLLCLVLLYSLSSVAFASSPIVQPGAPGDASRLLSPEQAIEIADTRYTLNDVHFMQDMIPHHQQALEMSKLAPTRTNSPALLEISGRIEASQEDEIAFMTQWLCLLYTSPSPRDVEESRMPSSA